MVCTYDGITFKTELLARWAAFFDIAEWEWRLYPHSVGNWQPDYRVNFECGDRLCKSSHTLFVAVLPIYTPERLEHHPAIDFTQTIKDEQGQPIADAGAVFGINPGYTKWMFEHNNGKAWTSVPLWIPDHTQMWAEACEHVRNENVPVQAYSRISTSCLPLRDSPI